VAFESPVMGGWGVVGAGCVMEVVWEWKGSGFLGMGITRGFFGGAGVGFFVVIGLGGGCVGCGGWVGVVSSMRSFIWRLVAVRGVGLVWKWRCFF